MDFCELKFSFLAVCIVCISWNVNGLQQSQPERFPTQTVFASGPLRDFQDVATHPAAFMPTMPHLSLFNSASTEIKELLKLIKSEQAARAKIEKRQLGVERSLKELKDKVDSLSNRTDESSNSSSNETLSSYEDLKQTVNKLQNKLLPIVNELASVKNTTMNATTELEEKIGSLSTDMGTQQNSTDRFQSSVNHREKAIEEDFAELSRNLSNALAALENKTSVLADIIDKNPTDELSLIIEDRVNKTIKDMMDMIHDVNASANGVTTSRDTLIHTLLGEITTLYKMTTRNEGHSNNNTADLKKESEYVRTNLTATIQSINETLHKELDTMNALHNTSTVNILKRLTELERKENEIVMNLTEQFNKDRLQLFENLALIDQNVNTEQGELKQLEQTVKTLNNQIQNVNDQSNKTKMDLEHAINTLNSSSMQTLSKMTNEMKDMKNKQQQLATLFNTSISGAKVDADLQKENMNNFRHNISLKLNSLSAITQQNISELEQNLNDKILQAKDHANISDSLTKAVTEVENKLKTTAANFSKELFHTSEICHHNISKLKHMFEDSVKNLKDTHNTSFNILSQNLINVEENAKSLGVYYNKTLKNIADITQSNISNIEQRLSIKQSKFQSLSAAQATIGNNLTHVWKKLNDLKVNRSGDLSELTGIISHNLTAITEDFKRFESKIISTESTNIQSFLAGLTNVNKKISDLARNYSEALHQVHVNNLKDKIAITTCADTHMYNAGSVIQFRNNKTSYGLDNSLSEFYSSGKFSSRYPGLYLISVQVMSYSKGAEYKIVKNDNEIIRVQVAPYHDDDSHNYHTGSGTAVVDLDINDKVWIQVQQAVNDMYIYGPESCLTIVKLH